MKMKRVLALWASAAIAVAATATPRTETLASPNGNITVEVGVGRRLTLSAYRLGEALLIDCPLSLEVGTEAFGLNPGLSATRRSRVDEVLEPVVPLKQARVANRANQLTLSFRGGISLDVRAYDNGLAYRFRIDKGRGQVDVVSEGLGLRLAGDFTAHLSPTPGFSTSYEDRKSVV